MTVRQVNQNDIVFQGYSSDSKPGGPNGATFHCIDTGEVFVCHEGVWSLDLRVARAMKNLDLLT